MSRLELCLHGRGNRPCQIQSLPPPTVLCSLMNSPPQTRRSADCDSCRPASSRFDALNLLSRPSASHVTFPTRAGTLGNWRQLSDFCGSRWRVSLNSYRLSHSPIINHPSGNEQAGGRQQSGRKYAKRKFHMSKVAVDCQKSKILQSCADLCCLTTYYKYTQHHVITCSLWIFALLANSRNTWRT